MQEAVRHLQATVAGAVGMMIVVLATVSVTQASGPVASSGLCTVAVTPVAFGMYNPLRHKDAVTVGMLHYRCSGTHRRLNIGLSTGQSGSFKARILGRGGNKIIYNLYLDSAGTQVWGDGSRASQMYIVNSPTSGSEMTIPIYGRLFGNQNASAGSYEDNVSVVVSY